MAGDGAPVLQAAGLMLGYAALVGLADNAVPRIALSMSLWQFLALRAALASLMVGGYLAVCRGSWVPLRPRCLRLVGLRAVIHALAIACFFASMETLSPPQALAALIAAPLFAVALDAVLRRRRPRITALVAVGCGFAGVILALPGSMAGAGAGLVAGLLAGALYAGSNVMARTACAAEHPLTLTATYLVATGVLGTVAMAVVGTDSDAAGFLTRPPVWPERYDWALLAGHAAANLIGVTLMLAAWQRVDAAWAGTLQYLCLPASCFWAWVLWGWLPTPAGAGGMGLVAAAGMLVLLDGTGRLRPAARRGRGAVRLGWGPSPGQAACFWPAKRS